MHTLYLLIQNNEGVMLPGNLQDKERGLKLALTGAIKDSIVGEHVLADYLLYILNTHKSTLYVDHYKLGMNYYYL